ncbi:hypothetical protein A3A79_00230 [Candidatus Gottesmanbacteria bacterium RIFCSPLOWO2_01_FULL_43_11b]|uniref:Uncharacterized protein n=1 Tax=Candidatus Gottesmanbacteria bacterium RIFCSPLOWO2_01_FULL_43_11b TaxID=1798392 RepID=A0A1F6AG96_9BACT|nr:MAG: hypothetical protein A3A79_00230 [Candidatus Gottesmanbacteria bacterium RIFCSPLOWO2_01_FULL_43_11b]
MEEKKEEEPKELLTLTKQVDQMVHSFEVGIRETKKKETPMHVDEIASRIAKFYEMVRKVIDWKEDNVLRRAAIVRILKRLLFPKISGVSLRPDIDTYRIAYSVTADLIRGGHLPNDEIPQESVLLVETAVKKYLHILKHASFATADPLLVKRKINFTTFLIDLAACEIEEILTNPIKERAIIQTMTELMTERIIVLPEGSMNDDEKRTHVFIAICRTLYELDDEFIIYQLLKFSYPGWHNPDAEQLKKLTEEVPKIWKSSDSILDHPLARQFYTICERVDTIFMLLGDILDKYVEEPKKLKEALQEKNELTKLATEAYDKRYKTLKTRLVRLAIFSTLSVFLSNWVTFYIIEVPLAEVFYEGFNLFTAFIDFLIPTALMFILVAIIRPPPEQNAKRVLSTLYRFVYEDEKKPLFEVRLRKRRNIFFTFIVAFLYFAMMFLVLGGVWYIFYFFKLPITSVFFDTFTIALTIFAAVLIRNKARELSVDDRTTFWEFILDMFSVPVAKIGEFLAAKWKEYNIIAILFTFLIETPFVVVLDFIENWSQYLKERRSELH